MPMPLKSSIAIITMMAASSAIATPVYLNNTNISVSVGAGTSAGSFNNTFGGGSTIDKVIDAPTADAQEFHNQTSHIWFTADSADGGLELLFDFGQSYDISTLHFWNYDGEGFDVDNIDFSFFDQGNAQVGALSVQPALGSSPAISAQDITLAAPLNVQFVTAFLTGTNGQIDFQNIGFTAEVSTLPPTPSAVPIPAAAWLFGSGLLSIIGFRKRQSLT